MAFDDVSRCSRELLCCCLHEWFEVGLYEISLVPNIKFEDMTDFKSREHDNGNTVHKFLDHWPQSGDLFDALLDLLHHWGLGISSRNICLLPRRLTAIANCQDPPDVGMKLTGVHRPGVFLRRCGHIVDIRAHVPFSTTWNFAEQCLELIRTCTLLLLILGVIDGRIQLRN